MTGLNGIISDLERQKRAIDKALAALGGIGGTASSAAELSSAPEPAKRRGGMTPAGKKRLIAALKKRWAVKKAAAAGTAVVVPTKSVRKGGMTEEGRRRLAEAMKKRWAVKRAASAVKKPAG